MGFGKHCKVYEGYGQARWKFLLKTISVETTPRDNRTRNPTLRNPSATHEAVMLSDFLMPLTLMTYCEQ